MSELSLEARFLAPITSPVRCARVSRRPRNTMERQRRKREKAPKN